MGNGIKVKEEEQGWVLALVLAVAAMIGEPHEELLLITAFVGAFGALVLYLTGWARLDLRNLPLIRRKLQQPPAKVPNEWATGREDFERLARDFWHILRTEYAKSDIHGGSIDWDSLTSAVRTAGWPDDEPPSSDRNVSSATEKVGKFTRRIYTLDGKSLFRADEVGAFEKTYQPIAQILKRWWVVLDGPNCARFSVYLRENLSSDPLGTLKLHWYVAEAYAAHKRMTEPDYRPWVAARTALKPPTPKK